MTGLY